MSDALMFIFIFLSNMVHLLMLAVLEKKNIPGECSSGLFTACKRAYLVVLTVNVMVVFFCFYDVFFLAACVLQVKAAQTSG